MVNIRMTTRLVPFNRRLILPSTPFFGSQRYIYKMTSVSSMPCQQKQDISLTLKRNAITWPNLLEYSKVKPKLKLGGSLLYENIADTIDYEKFFLQFKMEDTFFSWFLITELHVWILALRIMQEEEHGIQLRNYLIEAMWNDVKVRTKKLGSANASLMTQQLGLLSEQFNAALVGYDEAIFSSDTVLANHLWKRFFCSKTTEPIQLEQLVGYVRRQAHILANTPTADIFSLNPSITWTKL